MKKKFTLVLSALLMAGMVYDYNYRMVHSSSGGAPDGRTGSPGDNQTCFSGCHGNSPGNGIGTEVTSVDFDIPSGGYVPGTTYNISVAMTGGGSSFGFSLSAQNSSGTNLGTLIAGSDTQLNGSGNYITQTSNAGSGSKTWNFQWTAPASGSGLVTFYAASIFGDGMAGNNGDYLVLAENAANEASGVGISEAELAALSVYPNPVIDEINIAAKDVDEEIMVTLFNIEGKKVIEQSFEPGDITIDVASKSLNTGVYFLQLELNGNFTTKKLLVK